MATWSIAGGVVTLELTGGEVGPELRERIFSFPSAPNQQHTFYLKVNASHIGLEACLQVVGGDTALVTVADELQTLMARGDTDGSGDITVRFGVLEPGGGSGGGGGGSDDLSYANAGAAAAADWSTSGGVTFDTGRAVGAFPTSIRLNAEGGSPAEFDKDFALTPGAVYRFRVWAGGGPGEVHWYVPSTITASSGASSASDGINGDETDQQLEVTITADGTGVVNVRLRQVLTVGQGSNMHFAGLTWELVDGGGAETVTFQDLEFCEGSGLGDGGTGTGGDEDNPGTDPIPEPPPGGWPDPVGGPPERPVGISDISVDGHSFWNMTVKVITIANAVALLNAAAASGMHLLVRFGPERAWLVNGRFSYDAWNDLITAFYENPVARAALEAAILAGRVWHYLLDEPFRADERYGGPIPFGTVERMCGRSKELFENWLTIVRTDPTDERLPRAFDGCDAMWAEYSLARGPVLTYRRTRIEGALDLDVDLIFGIHYKHFEGPSGPSPRYVTPPEFRHYFGTLATPDPAFPTFRTIAMGGWKYENGLWVQPGDFPSALRFGRDLYASFDP